MVEPIALTDDILNKSGEFTNTFFEWVSKEGRQINQRANRVSSGTTTIYAVPEKHIFYLMSANLSSFCDGGGVAGTQGGSTIGTAQFSTILTTFDDRGIVSHQSVSTTFPYGLKFEAGEIITLGLNVADTQCFGSIQGFEIKKEIAVRR